MKISNTSLIGIGNTPLVRLQRLPGNSSNVIFGKLEGNNPAGSVKDRPALSMIKHAETRGEIKPGDILIEATSGNTGIAFASMGAYLGNPVQIYMPSWLSDERKRILRFYGATLVEITEKEGGFQRCIELAEQKSRKK